MDAARARQVQLKWYERTQPFGEGTAFLLLMGACTIDGFQGKKALCSIQPLQA
jgi:hypothetical protein